MQANVKHWSPDMYGQLVVLFPASCASTAAAEFQSGVCVGLISVADVGSASLHAVSMLMAHMLPTLCPFHVNVLGGFRVHRTTAMS